MECRTSHSLDLYQKTELIFEELKGGDWQSRTQEKINDMLHTLWYLSIVVFKLQLSGKF